MKTIGKALFCIEYKEKVVGTEVYIVKELEKTILSLAMLEKLKSVPKDFPYAQVATTALDEKVEPAPVFTGPGPELDTLWPRHSGLVAIFKSQHQTGPQVCHQNIASISPRIKKKRKKEKRKREKGKGRWNYSCKVSPSELEIPLTSNHLSHGSPKITSFSTRTSHRS